MIIDPNDIDAPASEDSLTRLRQMGQTLAEQQAKVADLSKQLKEATAIQNRLELEEIPQLMEEVGVTYFGMPDGSEIRVKKEFACGITEKTRDRALRWLIENGFGGLIKTEVALAFGRGERDEAEAAAARLANDGEYEVEMREAVHPATLKSFVKERMESGETFPLDLFNVRPYDKATLKKGK